jgi:hypothetical protein
MSMGWGCLCTAAHQLAYCSSSRWYTSMESHGGMIRTGKNRRTRRDTCPCATLSTVNRPWTDLIANPGLRHEKPVTCLNHGTAQMLITMFTRASHRFLSWASWIQPTTSHPLSIRPVLILSPISSALRCYECYLFFRLSDEKFVRISHALMLRVGSPGSAVSILWLGDRGSIPGRGRVFFL